MLSLDAVSGQYNEGKRNVLYTIFCRDSIEHGNDELLQRGRRSVADSEILCILECRAYLQDSRQQVTTYLGRIVLGQRWKCLQNFQLHVVA